MPQPAQLEAAPRCMGHKTNGDPCPNPRKNGYNVCTTHGGRTPRGLASPNLKHGLYSKHLPERMAAVYDEKRASADYLALTDEIALFTTFIDNDLEVMFNADSDPETVAHSRHAIRANAEQLRKLCDSERVRLKDMQLLFTADQAAMIFGEITTLIMSTETDRAKLAIYSNGLHDIAKRHLNLDK